MRTQIFALITFSFVLAASTGFAQNAEPAATPPATSNTQPGSVPLLAVVVPAGNPPEQCITKIREAQQEYRQSRADQKLRGLLDFMGDQLCSIYLVMSSEQYGNASRTARRQLFSINEAQLALFQRITKAVKAVAQQEGSSSGTGGSTNLTSKGIAAKFISLASEYGALTQSTSNMTSTVQGTLAGIPVVLLKKGLAEDCSTKLLALTPCFHHEALNVLNRVSYSVSFDSSQNGQSLSGSASGQNVANAQSATFTGNSHTINAVSGKFIAWTGGKIDVDSLKSKYDSFAKETQSASTRELATFFQLEQEKHPAFQSQRENLVSRLKAAIDEKSATPDSIIDTWKSLGTSFVEALGVPENATPGEIADTELFQKVADFAVHYIQYLGREEEAALALAKPPILTFEYDENRPAGQPTNSVFRAIYQHKFTEPKILPKLFTNLTMTANGAFSIYDSAPSSAIPGASRLRDIQAAAQADHDFQLHSAITGKIGMTLTGAYYFQHQSSPAILNVDPSSPVPGVTFTGLPPNATQVFAEKGNISIGQLKLSVGSGSNIKVPISVTYSNRTELITKPTWRGQIGISYDFDSFFASAK